MVAVLSGAFGLAIGSFLNVVVYRLPRGLSVVRPRSRCPSCATELAGVDNVPVASWLVLRGRCRYCASPVSVRYPLVELATALAFAGTAAALPTETPLAPLLLVEAAGIAGSAIALDGQPVPPAVLAAGVLGTAALWVVTAVVGTAGRIEGSAVAALLAGVAWAVIGAGRPGGEGPVPAATPGGAARPFPVRTAPGVHRLSDRVQQACLPAAMAGTAGWLWPAGGAAVLAVATAAAIVVRRTGAGQGSRAGLVVVTLAFAGFVLAGAAVHGP